MTEKQSPIILVGGGTGGHIFPLVAIAEELEASKRGFIFVGSSQSLEEEVAKSHGWHFEVIEAGKWRRYMSLGSIVQNFLDSFRVLIGFLQSLSLIRRTGARIVFSKGGFVALPLLYAARVMGCKIIIHESDAVMGLTNRLSGKFASKVLTAFDPSVYPNSDERFEKVGIPLRKSLRTAATLKAPKKSRPVLLILPGSQGSSAINGYVKECLTQLLSFADVIHLTGKKDFAEFQQLQSQLEPKQRAQYKPYPFIGRELPYYFQAADLIVARGSATNVAEAALFKKAVFLIPLPTAAGNHQVVNARKLESVGAAVVREQYQLSSQEFCDLISDLVGNDQRLKELGVALAEYFNTDQTLTKIMKELNA